MAVEKVRITAELLDADDNVISSESITDEYTAATYTHTERGDFDYSPASGGNPPVLLPKNPPKGL
jgi:hypothetical protein